MKLENAIQMIKPLDKEAMSQVEARWNTLCKPLNSLGKLEHMVVQLAGICSTDRPMRAKRAVIVMGADNGVVCEGVTQTGQEVTKAVLENMTMGKTAVNIMAKRSGADVFPVDIGIASPVHNSKIIHKKVRAGTDNIAAGPAMTRDEAVCAIESGIDVIRELMGRGYFSFATGEMGIGNTTTSSAVCASLLNCPVEKVTGKGAGLSKDGVLHKIQVIKKSLEVNDINVEDPIDVLAKVGGLDIAGLAGCFIGAAVYQKPIFIDGFISSIAAYLASMLAPLSKGYMFPSHCSKEPAGRLVLDALGMEPYITADMCLGEGTGAVMGFTMLDYALDCYYGIPSFEENQIEKYVPLK